MSRLTKYGTLWGQLPHTTGEVHWVAPAASYTIAGLSYSASDDNDGKSPDRAIRTVNQAITNATASAGDVIALLEGTHTVTATVNVNKAGLSFVGVGREDLRDFYVNNIRPVVILTSTGTNDELLNITANNVVFKSMTIRPTTTFPAVTFQTTSALDNIRFSRCHFDLYTPAVHGDTMGISFPSRKGGRGSSGHETSASNVTNVIVDECTFESDGAQGPAIFLASGQVIVRGCEFLVTAGSWASPFIVATDALNSRISQSYFFCHGTTGLMSSGISAQATGMALQALRVSNVLFDATPGVNAVRGFPVGKVSVVNSFFASAVNRSQSLEVSVATFPAVAQMNS